MSSTAHRTVWKASLEGFVSDVLMPNGARVLRAAVQDGGIKIWFLCDAERALEQRRFIVAPTGVDSVPVVSTYIDSVEMDDGKLVFHVFEVTAQ